MEAEVGTKLNPTMWELVYSIVEEHPTLEELEGVFGDLSLAEREALVQVAQGRPVVEVMILMEPSLVAGLVSKFRARHYPRRVYRKRRRR